ncbi:MAG: MBG domain-containing protein [Candidatus Pseudobacter hemicellulosilyticus]|uniref:MBG domain-containing protein n=1 Tax=Candidatus Pseudobacter hemicellulosilyticus TaxID=3121375 RepID=A0AAJ5WXD5_9BACT|nr:MAG: MBG domain-containing protein [Pseudobacter sp.]
MKMNITRTSYLHPLLFLLCLLLPAMVSSQVLYVSRTASGAGNGSSWTNAYNTLQAAITRANAESSIKEIRISNGTYTEPEMTISSSYNITGSWNTNSNNQDFAVPTILTTQLKHRLLQIDAMQVVKLDRLRFFECGSDTVDAGGAIRSSAVLTLTNCQFWENKASRNVVNNFGGALYLDGPATIDYCSFNDNRCGFSGGAICNRSELTIGRSSFENNTTGDDAGAIYNAGNLTIHSTRFKGNHMDYAEGPVIINGRGGAIHSVGNPLRITNTVFEQNQAWNGGAIHASSSTLDVVNCTFYGNQCYSNSLGPTGLGAAIYNLYSSNNTIMTNIHNNIFFANFGPFYGNPLKPCPTIFLQGYNSNTAPSVSLHNNIIDPSLLEKYTYTTTPVDEANNFWLIPFFVDAANGNFSLMQNSPGVNMGSTDLYQAAARPGYDFTHQLRVSLCVIDIGAYEYQWPSLMEFNPNNYGELFVDPNSTYSGFGDRGSSWSKAVVSLEEAIPFLNLCPSVVELRLAKGTYQQGQQTINRPVYIRGGYDPQTGQQDWNANPTILQPTGNNRILATNAATGTIRVEGITFQGANTNIAGGAIYNSRNLDLSYCKFLNNHSSHLGGAVYAEGYATARNCAFIGNVGSSGGAFFNFGASTITNCSFLDNSSTSAGQHAIAGLNGGHALYLYNNIIWGDPGQVYHVGPLRLDHNIIRGVSGNNLHLINDAATDQLEADPLFTNGGTGNLRLQAGSPAINKGLNSLYENADGIANNNSLLTDPDLNGGRRQFSHTIDLGAYERQMLQQTITATAQQLVYGEQAASTASSSASLPLVLTPSDPVYASIVPANNFIQANRKGTVQIQVTQPGNAEYDPAPAVSYLLTIVARPVTITATPQQKNYGDADPVLNYSVNPQMITGDGFTGSLQRDPGEDAGSYAILLHDLSAGDNYDISYTGNNLDIQPLPVQVTADPQTKTYGDSDPTLTYQHAPALVGTDAFTGTLSRAAGENVGQYAISNGLSLSSNYTLNYTGAQFSITQKSIQVTADNKTKVYGQPDPAFTWSVSPALITGDLLTGALTRTTGEDAGDYAITIGSLNNPNYAIGFTAGQLTIGKAQQQISWNQQLVSDCNGNTSIGLTASSSSGLTVDYVSANTRIATISGNQLTIVGPGLATITARQPGNNNYYPATEVQQQLTSRLPANLLVKRWDDVLVFNNNSNSFSGWQWYKNDQPVNGGTGQYLYESGKLNGTYYATAHTAAGQVVPTCPVTLTPGASTSLISVTPNPVRPGQAVTVRINLDAAALQGASLRLFNIQGMEMRAVQTVTPQTSLTMPLVPGLYVVKLQLSTGAVYSVNVLVRS